MLIPYQVGDVVRTKAGGPKMTVSLTPSVQIVHCMWFDIHNVLHKSIFSTDTLEVVE